MTDPSIIHHQSYVIQKTSAHSFDYDRHQHLLAFSNIIAWTLWAGYLAVQAVIIREIGKNADCNLGAFWLGFFAEICISCNDLVHALHLMVQLLRKAKVELPRPHYRLMGDVAPQVDVFVPSCGEPVDVVINTAASAAGQDYPETCLRVMVLDDGQNVALRDAVEDLDRSGQFGAQILYATRSERGVDFKAGNLRFGIKETAKIGGGEYIASVDADMIADTEWLRRMVPHLLLDPKMAMVNQPQHYYNVAQNDPLSDQGEFDMWFTMFEPLNDRVGQAMCQGSGFIVRRSAIDDIGGWPLAQTGEDVMCTLKMLFKGWNLAYVREYLQHGTTANTLSARLNQKVRWAIDHIEFIGAFGLLLTTRALGALTWRELTSVTTTLGLVLLPTALFLAVIRPDIVEIPTVSYNLLLRMLFLVFIAGKLNDYIVYRHMGLTRLSKYQSLNTWTAPFAALGLVRGILPASAAPSFFVTGAFKSPINERSARMRASLLRRLLVPSVQLFIVYVLISSTLLFLTLKRSSTKSTHASPTTSHIWMLPGLALRTASCIWKMFNPVWYMISPPDVPNWRDLLQRDKRGVMRPKRSLDPIMSPSGSEKDTSFARLYYDALELGVLLYCLGCN